jgi:hypothetical protein
MEVPMNRPDFSQYVVHFTRGTPPLNEQAIPKGSPLRKVIAGSAFDRLVSILQSGTIYATPMPWTNRDAVAFTECPFWSLLDHAKRYSPFGVGFTKRHLFVSGGGPALYVRPDLFDKQQQYEDPSDPNSRGFHPHLFSYVTPFAPEYAPATFHKTHWKGRNPIDFTHEREWRCPHNFLFTLSRVVFVVVDKYEDVAQFPRALKNAIGRDRFIILDVYRQIEHLWPTHNIAW